MWRDRMFNNAMDILDTLDISIFDIIVTPAELEN